MVMDITTNKIGFQNLSYSMVALPLLAYLKLDGFASDGVTWDDIEPANVKLGADGKAVVNQKPVLYVGTFSLLATSNARNILDNLIQLTTPKFGKIAADCNITMTVVNKTTGTATVYTGGTITSAPGGDNANLDDGQADKSYKVTFTDRTMMPAAA